MLKGVDPLLSGALLRELDELGHGETVALVDRNFPAFSTGATVVRVDTGLARAAEALLTVLPLDDDAAIVAMAGPVAQPVRSHAEVLTIARRLERPSLAVTAVERFEFYRRARAARLVVLTREEEAYSNVLFVKGVVHAIVRPAAVSESR